jgi:hypothetical protein
METTHEEKEKSSSSQEDSGSRAEPRPTVSREKWALHARKKLAHGYVLIVNPSRQNANFFMPGKGYEMCSYHTAQHLIRDGIVVEAGTHYLGTLYKLSAESTTPVVSAVVRPDPR